MAAANDSKTPITRAFGQLLTALNCLEGACAVLNARCAGENVPVKVCRAAHQLICNADSVVEDWAERLPALGDTEFLHWMNAAEELVLVGIRNDMGDDDDDSGLNCALAMLACEVIERSIKVIEKVRGEVETQMQAAEALPA